MHEERLNIVKLQKVIASLTMVSAMAVPAIAFGASSAGASVIPTNFPGDNGTSCNAWHGAPGGFGPNSPFYTVSGPQGGLGGYVFGQDQGVITGQNNSGYSVYCNQ